VCRNRWSTGISARRTGGYGQQGRQCWEKTFEADEEILAKGLSGSPRGVGGGGKDQRVYQLEDGSCKRLAGKPSSLLCLKLSEGSPALLNTGFPDAYKGAATKDREKKTPFEVGKKVLVYFNGRKIKRFSRQVSIREKVLRRLLAMGEKKRPGWILHDQTLSDPQKGQSKPLFDPSRGRKLAVTANKNRGSGVRENTSHGRVTARWNLTGAPTNDLVSRTGGGGGRVLSGRK